MSVSVVVEKFDGIQERSADDGVAADPDAGGLADPKSRELIDGFISESAATADNTDITLLMDAARHDADLAFAWGDDARAVRSDQTGLVSIDDCRNAHHVNHGNSFRDADDQRYFGVCGFENRVRGVRRRDKNYRSTRCGSLHGFGDGVEYGSLKMFRAALAGSDTANDIRTVLDHLLCVESSFTPGKALHDEFRLFVDQDTHRAPPANCTAFCAPSFMPLAIVKLSPDSRRICWPFSTLVPSIRTTTGIFT